ncbi:TolC family outer membrane protein [Ramlibacter sp.]|uniref:TolC family outer membrane protein n=1 Tax=Ramlibacter sp. TaxID=1917967 RepID=UPI002D621985|nr:TolC family outer membrane protein [Ramlibacter sp.]HYD77685.1 TolC family outer membrane protein [Ramlibacter sp.]
MRLRPALTALAFAFAAAPAASTGLVETWRAAAAHDPGFAAARAAREAGQARSRQAGALWRPQAMLEAGAGAATSENAIRGAGFAAPGFGSATGVDFDTSITGGTSTRYGLAVRQPLVDRERDAQQEQLRIASGLADLQWHSAEQDLALRSADLFFQSALAAEQLRLLGRQEDAALKARVEAQDRFRIGDRPITDVHEATARAAALRARRLAAGSELEVRRARLADFTGRPADIQLPLPRGALPQADIGSLESWLERAERENPQVRMAEAQLLHARQETRKNDAVLSPKVDLVARLGRERLSGSGDFGRASQTGTQHSIGVQLSVPLYTGGMRSARHDESLALAQQASAELEQVRQQAAQQTRAAWLDLRVGLEKTAALEAGLAASSARLDATRTGVQAGDRTTLDLLNAQNDAAEAELALVQARVQLIMLRLRLAAMTGALGEADLAAVDGLLGSVPATVAGTAPASSGR